MYKTRYYEQEQNGFGTQGLKHAHGRNRSGLLWHEDTILHY